MIFIYGNYGIYELNYLSVLKIDYHFLTNLKSDNEETRNSWKIWNISIRFLKMLMIFFLQKYHAVLPLLSNNLLWKCFIGICGSGGRQYNVTVMFR